MPVDPKDLKAIETVISDLEGGPITLPPLSAIVVRVVRELVKVTVRTRICRGPRLPENPTVEQAVAALPVNLSLEDLKQIRQRMLEEP